MKPETRSDILRTEIGCNRCLDYFDDIYMAVHKMVCTKGAFDCQPCGNDGIVHHYLFCPQQEGDEDDNSADEYIQNDQSSGSEDDDQYQYKVTDY